MSLDLTKYRALFLEEATDHLGEISRALLELEKEPATVESIDTIFRMAHSIKSMAASLGYDSISEISHALEDRMERVRRDGRVSTAGLGVLFRGLESLEAMVGQVRESGEAPPLAEAGLVALLSEVDADPQAASEASAPDDSDGSAVSESPPEKKARS